MHGLIIEVQVCCPVDVDDTEFAPDVVATSLIYEVLYNELGLLGPANASIAHRHEAHDPTANVVILQLALALPGASTRDLPSIERITESVYCYTTLKCYGVIREVAAVHAHYLPIDGAWDVYNSFIFDEIHVGLSA